MKKSFITALLFASISFASGAGQPGGHQNYNQGGQQNYNQGGQRHYNQGGQRHYNQGGHNRGDRYNWIAPAVIGGLIGYGVATYPYYPPAVYAPPPVYIAPPVVYESVWNPYCQCYRLIRKYYTE